MEVWVNTSNKRKRPIGLFFLLTYFFGLIRANNKRVIDSTTNNVAAPAATQVTTGFCIVVWNSDPNLLAFVK